MAETATTRRRVVLVLAAVVALMLRSSYRGPLAAAVHSWGGNIAASFAVGVLALIAASRAGLGLLPAGVAALLAVEGFELTDGFGVMTNVYDPIDLLANVVGVAAGLAAGSAVARQQAPESSRLEP